MKNFPKMNYLIMYLTTCVAVDKDSCCDTKSMENFHGIDPTSVACMTECAVKLALDKSVTDENFDLTQTQCTVDCLGKKQGYITNNGTFLIDEFSNMATKPLQELKRPKTVENCFDQYRNETEKPWDSDYNDVELKIFYCIYKEIQLKCPIMHQRQPMKCLELQKYLRNDHKPIPKTECDDTEEILRDLITLVKNESI